MKSIAMHEKGIELLEQYHIFYNRMLELQDHILYYGKKYVEIETKSRLIHKFQITQNCLKRIEKRYIDVINTLQTQCMQRTF
jgi:hypothetical protein